MTDRGYTYIDSGIYDQVIHDCEPGAPQGRVWYETGIREESDLGGIPGHEDKNWVQYHLWQLGNVFSEFEDSIMAVKGRNLWPMGRNALVIICQHSRRLPLASECVAELCSRFAFNFSTCGRSHGMA